MNFRNPLFIIGLAVIALIGYSLISLEQQKVVNVLNWDFYIGESTIDTFQSEYQTRVNYRIYDSNEQARDFLIQGPEQFDIVIPSDYMMTFMKDRGLLAEIDTNRIPNLVNVDKDVVQQFEDEGWLSSCVPYLFGSTGFAVDSTNVDLLPVDLSWRQLADDAQGEGIYKGKIVILDDFRQVLGSVLIELGYNPNTTDEQELEQAVRLLQDLKPSILEFSSDTGKERMLSGSAIIAFAWSGDALQVAEKNADWIYSVPSAGGLKFQDGICIPKGAPNLDSAYNFINHLLDEQVHKEIVITTKYLSTNTAALSQINGNLKSALETAATNNSPLYFVETLDDAGVQLYEKSWRRVKG